MHLLPALWPALAVLAQAGNPAARPCIGAPEHRQLDFWVGEWDVSPTAGAPNAATTGSPSRSRVELIEDQCVVFESYATPAGYSGRSLNSYDRAKKRWEQFWTDNKGAIHHYVGQARGGNMYYEADGVRMTFFNQGPEQVRQLGEQSKDGGKTWTTSYDLTYRRRKATPPGGCPADADPRELEAVKAVATGIVAADNARALERVLGFYAADAVLMPPREAPVAGLPAIRPRYEALFAGTDPAIETRIDQVCVSGASAFVRGHNGGRMLPRDGGAPRPLNDFFLMLLRRQTDESWRISHLMWH